MKYILITLVAFFVIAGGFLYLSQPVDNSNIFVKEGYPQDFIYVSSSDGHVTKFNLHSLNQSWNFVAETEYPYYSSRKLIESDGILYATGSDGTVRLINMSNGKQIDKITISQGRPQSMAIDNQAIYLGLQTSVNNTVVGGKFIALDKKSYDLLWSLDEDPYSQSIEVYGDYLYSGITYSTLVKINKNTGDIIWSSDDHSHPINTIILENDVVYTAASDGRVRKINSSTGKNMWGLTQTIRESNIDTMAVSDNGIYIGTLYNEIIKFSKEGPPELWRYTNHTDDIAGLATYENNIISASRDGSVIVLNASTGRYINGIDTPNKIYYEVLVVNEN